MANKTIEPITIDGQEADAFMINTSFCQMGRCKVEYSIGDFNPDPAPGSFNALRKKNNSFLIITHYQRLLDYIKPDFVHVLMGGKIIKSGGAELALELEKKGYENFN